ncbi:diguanylate cyclase [Moritella marina ATCC 15381]|uniref:diguanylate cyclase n=1 Tax=Moritella marina ATCC 15381 TaxID=1202962 RepID=A0A5J6WN55_MORMI|nr:diguanylate cyclase [Moritella marina]QFI37912.1 diguanylate cyclase [Moritella marina ATCC 15381]
MKIRIAVYLAVIISVIITYQINRSEVKQFDKFQQSFQVLERHFGELVYQLQAIQYGLSQLTLSHSTENKTALNFELTEADTCYTSKYRSSSQMYDFENDFLVVSGKPGCAKDTGLHHKITEAIKITPMMTFLAGRTDHVNSLYFISQHKFVIVSPKINALLINPLNFEKTLFKRPYMRKVLNTSTEGMSNKVFISGPYDDLYANNQIMTFSIAIYMDGRFYGVLNSDILWHEILSVIDSDFYLINDSKPASNLGILSEPLSFDGNITNLRMVMPNSISDQMTYLFKNSITDIAFYFVAIVIAAWVLYTLKLRFVSKVLASESCHDPLTGLLNRRGFMAELENIQHHRFYSFMIIDLDNFKHVNDTYGHPIGDEVLIRVTTVIKQQIRENDILLRLGGEEFGLLIAYNKDNKQIDVFERICESVANVPHYSDDTEFHVTMSGGVVTTSSIEQIKSIKSVIKQADERLYAAKIAGKNRILYADLSNNEPLNM